jgi:hypothetical protein
MDNAIPAWGNALEGAVIEFQGQRTQRRDRDEHGKKTSTRTKLVRTLRVPNRDFSPYAWIGFLP